MEFYQEYSTLQFTNDFVFCHVLIDNPELTKEITELATGRKIKEIVRIEKQKSIKESIDGKGVRFDVVFEDDENTIYDIEMQQSNELNLPKRTRYYQSLVDLETLRSGAKYNEIKSGYIIFICTFDPFEYGEYKYIARTQVKNHPEIDFDDGFVKIFMNAAYKRNNDDIPVEVKHFLDYVSTGIISSPLTEAIDKARQRILNDDERRMEYMTLLEQYESYEKKGHIAGANEKAIEIAKKMLAKGDRPQEVAEITGLKKEDVEKLKM